MGASSGIGRRVAELLASRGVRIGVAARNESALKELKEQYPDNIEYGVIDICKSDAPEKLEELINSVGGMDVYLHVSGIGYDNKTLNPEREAEIINTNCTGFARMLSAAYNYFKREGIAGQIGAVTSVAGTNGIGRLAAYSASKKFAHTYMVALEQLSHIENNDIQFTDIRPGWVETPLLKKGVKYPFCMDLDSAALQILYALAKKERIYVFDERWKCISEIWEKIPDSVWVGLNVPVTYNDMTQLFPILDSFINDNVKLPEIEKLLNFDATE